MTTITISGVVTNAGGASQIFGPVTATAVSAPIVDSVTILPASAPAGTARVLTITAHDTNTPAQVLTYAATRSDGLAITQRPASPGVFDLVF